MHKKHTKHHHRFFVDPGCIAGDSFISTEKGLINQVKNVFRVGIGEEIVVLDNSGTEYDVEIKNISKNEISGNIMGKRSHGDKEGCKVTLYVPLIKNSNLELILEKCTELGVASFSPVIYEHSVVKSKEKKERWEKIVKEASEQSGRFVMPKIADPIRFTDLVETIDPESCFVAHEEEKSDIASLGTKKRERKEINVFVGPEGGFSTEEVAMMRERGFNFFGLGDNILRSETACILAVGIFSILW